MSTSARPVAESPVHYPECDALPMADNTKQFRWIICTPEELLED